MPPFNYGLIPATNNADRPGRSHRQRAMAEATTAAQSPISHTDRIRDLSEIDAEIAQLLTAAGHAVKALTGTPSASDPESLPDANAGASNPASLAGAKDAFSASNLAYLQTLQAISARLRRQAFALEEAGIISSDGDTGDTTPQAQSAQGSQGQRGSVAPPMPITNGGLGNFDVGWLNSRRDDVGRAKEGELWKQAREFLEESSS